ncbi:unnamed protein product [Tenebrio molitor]|nr:unnamed protein product [Tenebrio molitor]
MNLISQLLSLELTKFYLLGNMYIFMYIPIFFCYMFYFFLKKKNVLKHVAMIRNVIFTSHMVTFLSKYLLCSFIFNSKKIKLN